MKYGVVIVTYNRLELLKQCVEQCLGQSLPFQNIVIVNNCSTDGTFEYLETWKDDVRFVISHQSENLGGSGGFRVGIDLAVRLDLDWLLIIDDDAMIARDYIAVCDRFLKKHPDINSCSGTVRTEGKIQTIHRRRVVSNLCFLEANVPEKAYQKKAFRYDLSTFCGLMVRMPVLREIGLPKAEYFIWYDDTEFSLRLRPYGGIVNINGAGLDHRTKLPSGENSGFFARMTWRTYYGHRNRLDTAKVHFGKATSLILLAEFLVFIACGFLMQLNPGKRGQGRFVVRMLWDAMRDGWQGRLGKNRKYLPG